MKLLRRQLGSSIVVWMAYSEQGHPTKMARHTKPWMSNDSGAPPLSHTPHTHTPVSMWMCCSRVNSTDRLRILVQNGSTEGLRVHKAIISSFVFLGHGSYWISSQSCYIFSSVINLEKEEAALSAVCMFYNNNNINNKTIYLLIPVCSGCWSTVPSRLWDEQSLDYCIAYSDWYWPFTSGGACIF